MMIDAVVEELARQLCQEDGINPESTNWMGDEHVVGGILSWPRWREYVAEAELKLSVTDAVADTLGPQTIQAMKDAVQEVEENPWGKPITSDIAKEPKP